MASSARTGDSAMPGGPDPDEGRSEQPSSEQPASAYSGAQSPHDSSATPMTVEVQVPREGLHAGTSYEAILPAVRCVRLLLFFGFASETASETVSCVGVRSGQPEQRVRVQVSHASASQALPGQVAVLPLGENALFKVDLRGGRVQWSASILVSRIVEARARAK